MQWRSPSILLCICAASLLAAVDGVPAKPSPRGSYADLVARMRNLESSYPNLCTLFSAQDAYGLPTAGTCSEQGAGEQPCKQWVLEVGRKNAMHSNTPVVFLSGALHGNERIGPEATVAFAETLLAAHGESAWVKAMLSNRQLVIVPMANAVGYDKGTREELGIDVNRDFPFDTHPGGCMRSIAARSINEVFQSRIVLSALTFHGGDHVLAHPWGDTRHCEGSAGELSPCTGGFLSGDESGLSKFGNAINEAAGKSSEGLYRTGPMNQVIYPVHGGMEDWAYAGSWDHDGVVSCNVEGYDSSRTKYDNSTLRTTMFLVETAMNKDPPVSTYGKLNSMKDLMSGEGHIPRNGRLIAGLLDLAQPYATILQVDVSTADGSTKDSFAIEADVKWVVGGCLEVQQSLLECVAPSTCDTSASHQGKCEWKGGLGGAGFGITFRTKLIAHVHGPSLALRAVATVDQHIGSPVAQTHWVNMRTNVDWDHHRHAQDKSFRVQGQTRWMSSIARVDVAAFRHGHPAVVTLDEGNEAGPVLPQQVAQPERNAGSDSNRWPDQHFEAGAVHARAQQQQREKDTGANSLARGKPEGLQWVLIPCTVVTAFGAGWFFARKSNRRGRMLRDARHGVISRMA